MNGSKSALLHPRRSIAARVMLLVAVGSLTTLSILGLATWSLLRSADLAVVDDHAAVAQSAARQTDDQLTLVLSRLQRLANDARGLVPAEEHGEAFESLALDAWLELERLDGIFVMGLDGTVWSRVPATEPLDPACRAAAVASVTRAPRAAVTPLLVSDGGARVVLLVPFRTWQGELIGVVAGDVDPAGRRFAKLAGPLAGTGVGHLDLVDTNGAVLVTGVPHGVTTGARPVVASAPLQFAPWVVASHRAEATLTPTEQLARLLLWLGPLLVGGSLLLAWGAGWSVRRPLLALTDAAERLADGDLDTPVTVHGEDETGRLGRTFDFMREALRASRSEIEAANEDLEARVRERTRELDRLNQELRERERVRQSLLRKVITAQEDERRRIARELHDDACQTVTALSLRLETALAHAAPEGALHADLERARALASRSLDELHRLMHDLRPALLDDMGLIPAIRWYTERRLAERGVSARFESNVDRLRLPAELETAVFRAVQEALTNIERHAGAEHVLVELEADERALQIEIEDDGVGFNPSEMVPQPGSARGLGLLGIRERLDLAGGEARIDSSPGRGTSVTIRVPMPQGALDGKDPGVDR